MVKIWNKNTNTNPKVNDLLSEIDTKRIPRHVAIIMDGNGRWAKKRGIPRTMGHKAGVEVLRTVVKCCDQIGVQYLTVYAFSTENWRRPQTEIGLLMSLLKEYVRKELEELDANNVKINVLGNIDRLPDDVYKAVTRAEAVTSENDGLNFNLALNYGGRAEILKAVQAICHEVFEGRLKEEDISENLFAEYLYTSGMPEPELVIRTSGEMRISNFLLWQVAYSEFVVVEELWPDFNDQLLLKCIQIYQKRDRRFGGLIEVEE